MTPLAPLAAAAVIAFLPSQAAGDTEVFGRAKWEAAQEYSSSNSLQKNEQSLDIEIKSYMNDNLSIKAFVRALNEERLQRDDPSDIDLREFYLDMTGERAKVRLGRQQVVWGKTDGLRLLDLINPQDFREFILDDFIDSRIPLWMARADLYIGDDTLQILVIPDVTFNELPDPGDRFEPAFLKRIRSLPVLHLDGGRPAQTISNSEYGIRYSGFAGGWDYTVNYLHAWEDAPLYFNETVGGQAAVVRRYKRSDTFGGSFSKAFGSCVFRGELAVTPERYFTTTSPSHPSGQVKKTGYNAAMGLDYTFGDWLISGQLFESVIGGYEEGILPDEFTTRFSLLVNVKFFNEALDLKLLNIFGVNDSDNLARFSATYSITDEWKILGGLSFFEGPADSFFGQFDDADRVELEATYSF